MGVTEETYRELVKVGGYGETMDHIIRKCVEAYKREQAGRPKKRLGSEPLFLHFFIIKY